MLTVFLPDAEATVALGLYLAKHYPGRLLLCLSGPLGAGKTSLVKGIARGFDIEDTVTSPTFTMLNEYENETTVLYHFDLYRLGEDLKLSEQTEDNSGNTGNAFIWELSEILQLNSPVAVEWPEFAGDLFKGADHFCVDLQYASGAAGDGRQAVIKAVGRGPESFLSALADKLSQGSLEEYIQVVD